MRDIKIFKSVLVLAVVGIVTLTGCSRPNTSDTSANVIPYTYPTDTSSVATTQSTLPANIFDTTTAADATPVSSSAYIQQPNSQYACIQSNSALLGNFGSLSSIGTTSTSTSSTSAQIYPLPSYCYTGQGLTTDAIWQSGIWNAQSIQDVLTASAQLDPGATADAATISARAALAKAAIIRVARRNMRQRWQMANWGNYQNGIYAGMDGAMYQWLQSVTANQPFTYNYGYSR